MDRQAELSIIRAAYAKQVMAAARVVGDARLAEALGSVRREDFLGRGPWPIVRWFREYVVTPDADPVYLYTDDLVGIHPNGRSTTGNHHCMHTSSTRPRPLTATMSCISEPAPAITPLSSRTSRAPSGRVTGIEYEPELAARAKAKFAGCRNVEIIENDGTLVSFDQADVIDVNAGCRRPAETWLDRLNDGGRLILPMTSDKGFAAKSLERMASAGAVFRIERPGLDYFARWISAVAIFPCAGSRDEASERALAEAFDKGGWQQVTRLYRHRDIPEERAWVSGPGWCLAAG